MSQPEPTSPKPGVMAVGMALIVIGILILVPSGLCTAIFGAGAIYDLTAANPGSFMGDVSDVGPFALGVLVAAIAGFLMIRAGRAMRRRK